MPQPQQNVTLSAPGFLGLNTQDSPTNLPVGFASTAENCVIDRFGRIASRKGFDHVTSNANSVITGNIVSCGEFLDALGVRYCFLGSDDGTLYYQDLETPFEVTEVTTATTPTAGEWQYVSFNNKLFFVQGLTAALVFDPVAFVSGGSDWGTYVLPAVSGPVGTFTPACATSGFGHVFYGNALFAPSTVYWSDLGDGNSFGGDSGSIDVSLFWPNGYDKIVALEVHNNFLVIFGEKSILLYEVPTGALSAGAHPTNQGPAYMSLKDTIVNIGCIARDTVQNKGTDVMFLDSSGVRSLNRTITEQSVPIGDLSKNVRNDLTGLVLSTENKNNIKAVYSPEEALYCLLFPSLGTSYVFDTRLPLEDGSLRPTLWSQTGKVGGLRTTDGALYFCGSEGLFEYTGNSDTLFVQIESLSSFSNGFDSGFGSSAASKSTTPISFDYATHPITFDQPATLKFPKQVDVTFIGGGYSDINFRWAFDYSNDWNILSKELTAGTSALWGLGQWGASQWGPSIAVSREKFNTWGSGVNVKLRFSSEISTEPLSIQELNLQSLLGRIL